MATIDIFSNDAFSVTNLVAAVEKTPFKPTFLGSLGIFIETPSYTDTVFIEERDGTLNLIPTSPRGGSVPQRSTEKRTAFGIKAPRIAKGDRITGSELQNVRAFGSNTELMAVQQEVVRRMAGPVGLKSEVEYTWENMRLGACQGIVYDSDGSTVLVNWFTQFNISAPTEIAFDLTGAQALATTAGAPGVLRRFIQAQVVRPMLRKAQGAMPLGRIIGLCGDNFFDDLTSHAEVRQTYLNWMAAAEQRGPTAFTTFSYGGVDWVNYRGSDDASTIGINTDKVKFIPADVSGIFRQTWCPSEALPYVNAPGMPLYPMIIPDMQRQFYVDIEMYSYPLFVCTRPDLLYSGRRGA